VSTRTVRRWIDEGLLVAHRINRHTFKLIADYLRRSKFDTIVGEVSMPGQIIDKNYTVGQWQGGLFRAVSGVGFSDFAQAKLKTGWA